jgi:hypothetical protein
MTDACGVPEMAVWWRHPAARAANAEENFVIAPIGRGSHGNR